ncbi:uncharacterized protein ISCGN_013193 [Ixodes scapularis]
MTGNGRSTQLNSPFASRLRSRSRALNAEEQPASQLGALAGAADATPAARGTMESMKPQDTHALDHSASRGVLEPVETDLETSNSFAELSEDARDPEADLTRLCNKGASPATIAVPLHCAKTHSELGWAYVCGTKKKLNKKRIGASQIDTRPPVRRRTTPIPANEIKITLRPNQGLALGQVGSIELGIAIITQVGKPHICGKNDFTAYIRYGSNIVVISTARTDTAEEIKKITRLRLRGRVHEFNTHVVMDGTIKGVIHGISAGTKEEELMEFLDTRNDSNRIVQARMMGRSKTALLTFIGDRLPKVVYGMGTIISVNPYVPTRQVCYSCMKPGHRIDVCPFPDVKACQRCGKRQPEENHMCVPRCVLCGGEHVTGDKECKQKYKARFQAGSHQQGMSQRKEGEERKERKWQPPPETRRNEVIRKKYTEEDYPQLPASPWAAAATMTTATMGKGPTEETRRLRAHLGRKEAEVEKMKDEMATMRNEIQQLRNALKTQTERKNSEKPAYRAKPKPRGETPVPKTPSNEAQEMKQEMIKELKQEIQKWMTDMFKNLQIGRGAEENPPNKRRKNPYSKDESNYESDSSLVVDMGKTQHDYD